MSKVKDISLATWGRKQIELAEKEMPGLMAIRKQFGPSKALQRAKISGSLHMTIQTGVLIQTLNYLGAQVRWCSCNIFSTQDHAAAAIAQAKTGAVFAWKGETPEEYWELTNDCLNWGNGQGPDIIIDDGGDATLFIIEGLNIEKQLKENEELFDIAKGKSQNQDQIWLYKTIGKYLQKDKNYFSKLAKNLKGISEETTTGAIRLMKLEKQNKLPCPCMDIDDSVTKIKFDNVYGIKHSMLDGINRATDVMISGKKALVCGFGNVGKGCAQAFKGAGARVYVTESDPICALQACMQGFQVVRVEDVLNIIDIYVTATGNKGIITLQHMKKMKNNAIVGNIGNFDHQVDIKSLNQCCDVTRTNIKPQVDKYTFQNGNSIIMLAQGRLLNLGCATGHPSFVMSSAFSNQLLAVIDLWSNNKTNKYEKKVYKLPKILDEKVARLHLDYFGAKLTVLKQDQAQYIGVPVYGPFKNASYKY